MRLLPRTTRGTLTLAAAAWLTGTAFLWLLLPVAPRITVHVPKSSEVVGFLPDGQTLITKCGPESQFHVWDAGSGRQRAAVRVGSDLLAECRLSPDGRWLVARESIGAGSHLQVFEVATGQAVAQLVTDCFRPANRPWPTCRFAPDGRMLAACCSEHGRDSCVRTWDVPTWRERAVLTEATGPLHFSPDGKYLATVTAGEMWKRIRLWDTATFQACQAFSLDHGAARLAMSPGGRFLAITAWRGRSFPETVCWWEVTTGKPIGEVQTGLGFAFAADDQALAVELPAGADERVRIYDPESGAVTKRVSLRDDRKVPLSTMKTDHNILYVTLDQSDSWSEALQSDYWGEAVRWLHKKGITFITLGTYPTQMLDAVSGRPVGTLPVSALGGRWSPDGKTLAVMRTGDELQLWDIPGRKPLWLFLTLAGLLALPVAGVAWWRVRNASAKRR